MVSTLDDLQKSLDDLREGGMFEQDIQWSLAPAKQVDKHGKKTHQKATES